MIVLPKGLYGADRDGLADPGKFTVAQRRNGSVARLEFEDRRRRSPSPTLRRVQAVVDSTLTPGLRR